MDVVDTVSGKDTLAASRDLDAIPGREGARDDSYPYDNGRGRRLASVSHANWVQTRTLHPLRVQIDNHGGKISRRGCKPTGLDSLGSRYASGPVGSSQALVLDRATKRG